MYILYTYRYNLQLLCIILLNKNIVDKNESSVLFTIDILKTIFMLS